MTYHTPLVEYHHRCACGACINVITHSPEMEHDQALETKLAIDVLLLHLMLNHREPPQLAQPPPGFEPT